MFSTQRFVCSRRLRHRLPHHCRQVACHPQCTARPQHVTLTCPKVRQGQTGSGSHNDSVDLEGYRLRRIWVSDGQKCFTSQQTWSILCAHDHQDTYGTLGEKVCHCQRYLCCNLLTLSQKLLNLSVKLLLFSWKQGD